MNTASPTPSKLSTPHFIFYFPLNPEIQSPMKSIRYDMHNEPLLAGIFLSPAPFWCLRQLLHATILLFPDHSQTIPGSFFTTRAGWGLNKHTKHKYVDTIEIHRRNHIRSTLPDTSQSLSSFVLPKTITFFISSSTYSSSTGFSNQCYSHQHSHLGLSTELLSLLRFRSLVQ